MSENKQKMADKHGRPSRRQQALVTAWLKAATELGLQLDRDVKTVSLDGHVVEWPLRIRNFGRSNGIVVDLDDAVSDMRRRREAANAAGLACSFLSAEYETYNRELFKSTLDDWGWHGNGRAPLWYTGVAWT